ncbi:MAG: hypothetical protein OXQ31_27435 [Spirochaetaceae bacterium]|nr:hypothetical protein [Spirochaetaceae bacterium]
MIRSPAARALIALALACFLGACTGSYRTLVHVDTVHADVAAYAERYNLSQDRYRVVTRFANAPAESLAHGGSDADVLIGPGLAGRDLAETLLPLDGLFRSGLLRASAFFPSLLESGRADGVLRALPLSFRVPVIAVRAGRDDLPSFSVTPDELAALGPASRSWSAELVYQAAVLYGADFRRLPDGRLGLRQAAVDRAVDQARRWFEAEPGGLPSDTLPPVQMLLDGRIEFFLTDLHRFVDIPAERRDQLAMRWLGSGEGLLAADDLTYAAIRARAPNARGAQAFLLWLFEPATQAALLELGRREQLTGFGIAGGIPALVEAASHDLPTHHPVLVGRVPTSAELRAPAALGADWARLREAVVLPWLWAETRGAEQPALADAVAAWRQRRADGAAQAAPGKPAGRSHADRGLVIL